MSVIVAAHRRRRRSSPRGFLGAFVWAVRTGQFDDTCTPAVRVLLDDVRGRRNSHEPSPHVERSVRMSSSHR